MEKKAGWDIDSGRVMLLREGFLVSVYDVVICVGLSVCM